ncbi:MAG: hypothetical protein BWY79_02098 [Actinobacteria bacterium ADurb.Bin444]|nr:MAG: hypothetical protein BWY79_02098 [Actinobacteria bacterium ADurb.Bin444]
MASKRAGLTEAQAEAAKRAAVQARVEACRKEMEAVLSKHRKEHGCALVAVPFIREDGGIGAQVQVRIVPEG